MAASSEEIRSVLGDHCGKSPSSSGEDREGSVEASKIKIDFLFDKKVEVTGSYMTLSLIRESFQAAVRKLH